MRACRRSRASLTVLSGLVRRLCRCRLLMAAAAPLSAAPVGSKYVSAHGDAALGRLSPLPCRLVRWPALTTPASRVGCRVEEGGDEELTSRLELLEKLIKASRAIAMQLDPFEGALRVHTAPLRAVRRCCVA